MDFKKFSSDANAFFNRALQKTEEALKTSERTLLDANLENSIKQCEMRQRWAQGLIQLTESMIQPNPAMRMEDMVLKGFDRKKERMSSGELLGDSLIRIGNEMGASSPHGSALIKCGEAETTLGQHERTMTHAIEKNYLEWLRKYVNEDCKEAMKERTKLEETRLDLDRNKTLLRRAKDDVNKKQQLEQQVSEAQTLFNRQCDATRQAMETCIGKFDEHKTICKELLNAQLQYFKTSAENLESAIRSL